MSSLQQIKFALCIAAIFAIAFDTCSFQREVSALEVIHQKTRARSSKSKAHSTSTSKKGKKITKDKTYFPGYIMIKANLTGEVPHVIKSVTNVIGFLGETKGGDPIPLRQSEVNRMLGKVDEFLVQDEADIIIPFIHGENVKVIDGPFNGFDGTIEKINEEKRKLEVMVKIFGRKTPLELSYMQVEKL